MADKMFDEFENGRLKAEEIRGLTEGECNNITITDKVREVTYEVECEATLDDLRARLETNDGTLFGKKDGMENITPTEMMKELQDISQSPSEIRVEAYAKTLESVVQRLPEDCSFLYKDTYDDTVYQFDGYDSSYTGAYGTISISVTGDIDASLSDDIEESEISDMFDEAIRMNETMSEHGFGNNFSSELESEKTRMIDELEADNDSREYGGYEDY